MTASATRPANSLIERIASSFPGMRFRETTTRSARSCSSRVADAGHRGRLPLAGEHARARGGGGERAHAAEHRRPRAGARGPALRRCGQRPAPARGTGRPRPAPHRSGEAEAESVAAPRIPGRPSSRRPQPGGAGPLGGAAPTGARVPGSERSGSRGWKSARDRGQAASGEDGRRDDGVEERAQSRPGTFVSEAEKLRAGVCLRPTRSREGPPARAPWRPYIRARGKFGRSGRGELRESLRLHRAGTTSIFVHEILFHWPSPLPAT